MLVDFAGHPFTALLSRTLAARGHTVCHLYAASSETPKGDLVRRDEDAATLEFRGVTLAEAYDKRNFVRRFRQERTIGHAFARHVADFAPEVTMVGTTPIDTFRLLDRARRRVGSRLVFWVQDLLGEAMTSVLGARLGRAGTLIGRHYARLERRLLRAADHCVVISDDFVPPLLAAGVVDTRITVIENWGPLASIPPMPRDNDWARANLPPAEFRMVYSGTLGFKQNPHLLLALAKAIPGDMVIFSEGVVARQLADDARAQGVRDLHVRAWVPLADLPHALAAADLFVVTLEPDASLFSVPSKVLAYLCAGRPILASIDPANLASRTIERAGAGTVIAPGDDDGFTAAANALRNDASTRAEHGIRARRYAEQAFDLTVIADRFETIFRAL